MTIKDYRQIEEHMLHYSTDVVHDSEHIYRVLERAKNIANNYKAVDSDVLVAACLLHDIGREKEFDNPALCHAAEGSVMAYDFLIGLGWSYEKASHVKDCISTHRYRGSHKPDSLEAEILFDSDKLDSSGVIGICRTLLYQGIVGTPLYTTDRNRKVDSGTKEDSDSFVKEYQQKLRNIPDLLFTKEAREIALKRQKYTDEFFSQLLSEIASA